MSWMTPSYVLQADFNTSWTPLATRYTLWLYREVGWEPTHVSMFQLGLASWLICAGHGVTGAIHTRECRLIPSSPLDRFLRYQTVFLVPICRLE